MVGRFFLRLQPPRYCGELLLDVGGLNDRGDIMNTSDHGACQTLNGSAKDGSRAQVSRMLTE